ncbi:MAG: exodeoxyribonuclease III [Myxococcota bacterium]|nr:exodeoxyribonuclease III [Myxococcota bacterium]
MRVATWNINGVRARLDFVRHWLRARRPDLVGLQELKVDEESFPLEAFEEEGYHAAWVAQKSWNGVAVLGREPLEVLQRGLPGQDDFGARLLTVRAGGLVFTTVYCPNGKRVDHPDFPAKLRWFDALRDHLDVHHRSDAPAILCGDFNVCPAPIDSWNEEELAGRIFHTDEERARMRSLLDWGFRDLFREAHPQLQAFSWWDYRGGAFHRRQGLRIDLLLGTAPVWKRVREVAIDRDYRKKKEGLTASDHAPVWADLE